MKPKFGIIQEMKTLLKYFKNFATCLKIFFVKYFSSSHPLKFQTKCSVFASQSSAFQKESNKIKAEIPLAKHN